MEMRMSEREDVHLEAGMDRRTFNTTMMSVAVMGLLGSSAALAQPPHESGAHRAPDLVELIILDPTLRLDVRYATTNNFLGTVLYKQARAFLQRPAAEALVRVQRGLARNGLGLMVFDGYRPWGITKLMWDRARPEWRSGSYVADPAKGSRHNRGCAVDLTLCDLVTGKPLEMPTPYDDFHVQAHAFAQNVPARARANRAILQKAMLAEGYRILDEEWWHFDYKDYPRYGILDVDFARIPVKPGLSPARRP